MRISSEMLITQAEATGFRTDILEKVGLLIHLLEAVRSHLFRTDKLEPGRLRLAFVLYGAMNRRDWRIVAIEEVSLDIKDFEQMLFPTLRSKGADRMHAASFIKGFIEGCRHGLAALLPFTAAEMEFLDRLLDMGEINPELLTADEGLQDRIRRHPLLEWKALNVREFIKNQ